MAFAGRNALVTNDTKYPAYTRFLRGRVSLATVANPWRSKGCSKAMDK